MNIANNLVIGRLYLLSKVVILAYTLSGTILANLYSQSNIVNTFRANTSHYSTDEGLPHNHVYQIFQDDRGMMWLIVGNGLVIFDGRTFTRILTWPFLHTPDGVEILFEDGEANLWLRCRDETGAITFTLVDTRSQRTTKAENKLPWMTASDIQVKDVAKGHGGTIWYINERNELWQKEGVKSSQKVYTSRTAIQFCAYEQLGSRIWLYEKGRNGVINRLVGISSSAQITRLDYVAADVSCSPAADDELWLFDKNHLSVWSPEDSVPKVLVRLPERNGGESSERTLAITDTERKRIWYFAGGELIVKNLTGEKIYETTNNGNAARPIGVFDIAIDESGYAWIGTIQGLYVFRLRPERFEKILWTDPLRSNNHLVNTTRGIQENKQAELLINAGSGLYVKRDGQPSASLVVRFRGPMYGLAIDGKGTLWASMGDITRYDPERGRSQTMVLGDNKGAMSYGQ